MEFTIVYCGSSNLYIKLTSSEYVVELALTNTPFFESFKSELSFYNKSGLEGVPVLALGGMAPMQLLIFFQAKIRGNVSSPCPLSPSRTFEIGQFHI